MRKAKTSDFAVVEAMKTRKGKSWASVEVATALKLTVFQITARLKGMEGRGLVERDEHKLWRLTDYAISHYRGEKEERFVIHGGSRGRGPTPPSRPDDKKVRRIEGTSRKKGWTDEVCWNENRGEFEQRFTDPQGRTYAIAHAMEPADLIVGCGLGLEPVRLRLVDKRNRKTKKGKTVEREKKEQEKRKSVKKAQREKKKKVRTPRDVPVGRRTQKKAYTKADRKKAKSKSDDGMLTLNPA